jgi:hypothetical protein
LPFARSLYARIHARPRQELRPPLSAGCRASRRLRLQLIFSFVRLRSIPKGFQHWLPSLCIYISVPQWSEPFT